MRALALLLLLTPFCVGWNGSGPAVTDIASDRHASPDQFRSEAVCAAHTDRVEIIIVVPLLGEGDGVLSLRFDRNTLNRDVDLPSVLVRARYREYGGDGSTRFAGAAITTGYARLSGDPRGALDLAFDARFTDGAAVRHVVSDARLVALDWSPSGARLGGVDDDDTVPEGYYEGGCSGTYYESDYEDDAYDEGYEDDGGCGGDDLGDEPADDSGGGCAGDDDDYSSDSDASGDTGCGGDDDYDDDDDDDSGCGGDDLEEAIVGLLRGDGGGPWIARLIRWMPWMCIFLALRLMRRRRPRSLGQSSQPA